MALAINIEDLLKKQKIESTRIEFKKGWNPSSIYHSVCAFANDFDDIGGGYIIVGVDTDQETGVAIRPVLGVPEESIDDILQDMVGYNNKIEPYYMPRTSKEEVDGKNVLVIWCPAGVNRPYSVPENVTSKSITKQYFYIRSGTSSIIAKGEVLDELREMASRVPYDEKGNPEIKITDISPILVYNYLRKTGSRLLTTFKTDKLDETLEHLNLYTGPKECRMLKNVAAMMFCENPSKFFPYMQVDVVNFPKGKIKDPNNFTEITFKGCVTEIIKNTLDHLRSAVIKECVQKIAGQAESRRFWNYPYEALEETVVNSLYHRDYRQYEPVEITIEPDGISILNCPGPDRSISREAIEKGELLLSRRYRNRRLGDFLKELDLTEGRSTGVPTIQQALADNGSPRATFETSDDRLTFLIHIPVRSFETESDVVSSSETMLLGSETLHGSSETGSETLHGSSETLSPIQIDILRMIENDPAITTLNIAHNVHISTRGIEKHLRKLKDWGYLVRIGSATYGGSWKILKPYHT